MNCRLLETSLGCSITVEHEKIDGPDDIRCTVRFHGRHSTSDDSDHSQEFLNLGLSPIFPLEISRDGRTQTHLVFQDIGEVKNCFPRYQTNLHRSFLLKDHGDWNWIAVAWESRIESQVDRDQYSTKIVSATVSEKNRHVLVIHLVN